MSNPFLANLLAGKAPAPASSIEAPGPTPPVATPDAGSMAGNLKNILAQFAEKSGAIRVNPPEAAKVLATKTLDEVRGKPEPEADDGPEVEPPTSKPDSVKAAEALPRPRRTAAVVQEDLDALVTTHNKLSAAYETLKNESLTLVDSVRQEMKAENALTDADLAKAIARADGLDAQLSDFQARAALVIRALNEKLAAAGSVEGASCPLPKPLEDENAMALARGLSKQGWTVTLTVPAA